MKEISQLLKITRKLSKKYNRGFTLDGKLVGDIGEVLSTEKYRIKLLESNSRVHDAREEYSGRLVQIKSSFTNRSYFPCNHVPDYYLAIQILEDGTTKELFNGKGSFIKNEYIKLRKLTAKKGRYLYTLGGTVLLKLNERVPDTDKIKLRN
jgi:hypothetical protein